MNPIILLILPLDNSLREGPSSRSNIQSFYSGEIVHAKVLQTGEESKVLIQLKGVNLWAQCRFPLYCGWEGYLRVESIYPQIVLKVILESAEKENLIPSWLRPYFVSFGFSENSFQNLFNLLETKGRMIPFPQRMMIESLLSSCKEFPAMMLRYLQLKEDLINLKGQLLRLSNSQKGMLAKLSDIKTFIEEIDQILQKIEGFQILHFYLKQFQEKEKMVFFFPLWFQHHGCWGELHLLLSKPKKEIEVKKDLYLLILLTLPDWGRLVMEVRLRSKNFYGHIFVRQPEVLTFIRENLSDLYSRLRKLGFNPQIQLSEGREEESFPNILNFFFENFESLFNVVV